MFLIEYNESHPGLFRSRLRTEVVVQQQRCITFVMRPGVGRRRFERILGVYRALQSIERQLVDAGSLEVLWDAFRRSRVQLDELENGKCVI